MAYRIAKKIKAEQESVYLVIPQLKAYRTGLDWDDGIVKPSL